MAQAFNKLGGIFPKGSGKGLAGGAGALITLGALGYGINASLFNGKKPLILSTTTTTAQGQ
jgi:prohibitin 2